MARCRAANSSCMGTSVVRPLAVAHGGYSRRSEAKAEVPGAAEAGTTDRERSDQLSVCFNKMLNDRLSGKPARSAVGSHLLVADPGVRRPVAPIGAALGLVPIGALGEHPVRPLRGRRAGPIAISPPLALQGG
jgi:hypothetical protein